MSDEMKILSTANEERRKFLFLALSGISLFSSFAGIDVLSIDAAWVAIVLCGFPILKSAFVGLIRAFDIKADVLVSIALIAAVIIGEIFAAGEVAFIMAIGALLEERTVAKARAGIEKLVHLTPRTARVVQDGVENIIPAEQVKIGDILRVVAGETIAVDGIITAGQTSVNQAMMTGESLPVDKDVGDEVFSGTVNQFGIFAMKATRVGEDSSLQRMIRLVESADASKAKIVRIADAWATWIVVMALASAATTWLFTSEIIRAVTILVVFCPCALVLATPTAIMAGIGNATRYGILVRQGDALERLAKVKRLAFDKTGTLTYGKPAVAAVESFENGLSDHELLALTASAERHSEHPLGKAIVAHFRATSQTALKEPHDFRILAGRGVAAVVDGCTMLAGNAELLRDNSITIPQVMFDRAGEHKNSGCTVIYIAVNQRAAGCIALADTLRTDAIDTIESMEETGIKSLLLTGDNHQAASHIAKATGIQDIHPNCLPEDKMAVIEQYQNAGEMLCMVGDGINDAPALKKAYVGVAMGGVGSAIAVDAADIALVGDDIKVIPHLLALSKRTMNTIKLNMIISMVLNFVAVLLAMTGFLNPVAGALVHNVGSVSVIVNSSLLLKWEKHHPA